MAYGKGFINRFILWGFRVCHLQCLGFRAHGSGNLGSKESIFRIYLYCHMTGRRAISNRYIQCRYIEQRLGFRTHS